MQKKKTRRSAWQPLLRHVALLVLLRDRDESRVKQREIQKDQDTPDRKYHDSNESYIKNVNEIKLYGAYCVVPRHTDSLLVEKTIGELIGETVIDRETDR